ncbi:MAG: glycosyltransferase [Thermoanaerobaculia bacterium]|nr:glycosyltransferase [Thermoanaerobaculia bacterium]
MKILFAGELHPRGYSSTSHGRLRALKELGHELCGVDYAAAFEKWSDNVNRLSFWAGFGPAIWHINRKIVSSAETFRPEILWVDKGNYVFPETLEKVRAACGARLVHYTPDPAFVGHRTRHFVRGVPLYDLVVTTKGYEETRYAELGPKRILYQLPSYDRDVHFPVTLSPEERGEFDSDLVFVGTYAKGRERFLRPLVDAGLDLAIWGSEWHRCTDKALKKKARFESLAGPRYRAALSGARIGLGILSPLWPDKSTTRSLEIPACGTFLLAERTDEHQQLFEEGREAEFFSTEAELVEKARFFLDHDALRTKVARAGRERCERSGYSSLDRVRQALAALGSEGPCATHPEGAVRSQRLSSR